MKYADAKKKLAKVSKFDTTEIFYDKRKRTFYCYINQKLHLKAENTTTATDEVNLFHYVESTRSPEERESMHLKKRG
jgi:hypothetical protein